MKDISIYKINHNAMRTKNSDRNLKLRCHKRLRGDYLEMHTGYREQRELSYGRGCGHLRWYIVQSIPVILRWGVRGVERGHRILWTEHYQPYNTSHSVVFRFLLSFQGEGHGALNSNVLNTF